MATSLAVLPLAALLLPLAAPAQWQPRLPGTPGQQDAGIAAAWHDGGQHVVVAGSAGAAHFDGRTFVTDNGPQPPRAFAAIAYDRARSRVVLFGGSAGGADLGDTWEYDGVAWQQRTPAGPAPAARHAASMVYDEWRQRCVLVGGFANGLGNGDTWEWDGTAWTQRLVNAPGLRGGGAAGFDALRGYVIVFGGATTTGGPVRDDCWRFDGNGWLRLHPATLPTGRRGAALGYDRWTGRMLLFGGDDGTALLGDTWQWNGADWSLLGPAAGPAPRADHAMVLDESRHRLVLLGGRSAGGARGEVWTLTEDPRPFAAPFATGCNGHTLAVAPNGLPVLGGTFATTSGTPAGLMFAAIGFSSVVAPNGPLPQPLPGGCLLWIDPVAVQFLGPGVGTFALAIPAQPVLAGTEFVMQTFDLVPTSSTVTSSNGLEARIGMLPQPSVTATPLDPPSTEAAATALPGTTALGGDGRHGTFDPTSGTPVGVDVYEFDTGATTIPAHRTPSGQTMVVTDGRYYFDTFDVPAGITVRFRGAHPARIHVRGTARIEGVLDCSGDAMTTFTATSTPTGQPGGRPGPGGGRGGAGGDRCAGLGPTVQGGIVLESGRPGQDVQLPAGHPAAAAAIGTGGPGSPLHPSNGLSATLNFTIVFSFCGDAAAGGGGGGNALAGGGSAVQPQPNVLPGPNTAGGAAFGLGPVPAGVPSIDWYAVGGAGGGGGASHPYAAIQGLPVWRAGAGGSGGGGVLALRCGRDLVVGSAGSVLATGGPGVEFNAYIDGYPCPGGGGAGGTLLLQANGALQNLGSLDVSGGAGSRIDHVVPQLLAMVDVGGAGSPGVIRLESSQPPVPGTTVPPLGPNDIGPLLDRDARTGLRSVWLPVSASGRTPVLVRYELDVVQGSVPTTFSDDPAVGQKAADSSPIQLHFQTTRRDGNGQPDPATVSSWHASFGAASRDDNCNRDVPDFVRVDLALPANPPPVVQSLRLYWY